MPVCHLCNVEQSIHDRWKLEILIEFTRRLCKAVVIVVGSVFLFKRVKKLTVGKIYSLGSISEVSEPVVSLSLCPDDFVSCLLPEISLILPEVVCLLELGVVFEQTRSIGPDVLVEEVFWRDVRVTNFDVVRNELKFEMVLSHVISQADSVVDVALNELVDKTARSLGLLVSGNDREEDTEVENHEVLHHLRKREVNLIVFMGLGN